MTTYEAIKNLNFLLSAIGIDRVLTKYIFILSRGYQHISTEMNEMLYSKNRTLFSKKQQASQDKFLEARKQADSFPLGQIFHEAIELQRALDQVVDAFGESEDRIFREMSTQLDQFYVAFERFARGGEEQAFSTLMIEAHHLYSTVATTRQAFFTIKNALEEKEEVASGFGRLTLWFHHASSYARVVEKLGAIERVYLEVCKLVGVSTEEYPLGIVKIETGSLWVAVEGEERIMMVLAALIERYTLFLYRRLSTGDTSSISDRVLATQSMVNLVDELERVGVDHSQIEEQFLQKSALVLRRDLVMILAGEPSVKINETPLALEEMSWPRYIEESLRLLPQYAPVLPFKEQVGT